MLDTVSVIVMQLYVTQGCQTISCETCGHIDSS